MKLNDDPYMIADCTCITTSGTRVQTLLNGKYSKRSEDCDVDGRPSYMRTSTSQDTVYLYFFINSDSEMAVWGFSPNACQAVKGYAENEDNAATPDLITNTWVEYNGNSWVSNPNMRTTCKYYHCSYQASNLHVRL